MRAPQDQASAAREASKGQDMYLSVAKTDILTLLREYLPCCQGLLRLGRWGRRLCDLSEVASMCPHRRTCHRPYQNQNVTICQIAQKPAMISPKPSRIIMTGISTLKRPISEERVNRRAYYE
jgi:hypothetical protein